METSDKKKNIMFLSTLTTTLLLAIILIFLFNFNFDAFKAGAAPPEVRGQGTAGFIAKWSGPTIPTISNVTFDEPDYCSSPGGAVRWDYLDLVFTQDGYRVQIDNNSTFGSPEIDSCPSGSGCGGGVSTAYSFTTALSWATIYYARVMVWNVSGIPSLWQNMSACTSNASSGKCLTSSGNPRCATGQTSCWQTPLHAYPDVDPPSGTAGCNPPSGYDFTWSPCNPGAVSEIQFTDRTNFIGGSTNQQWKWTFTGGTPSSSTVQSPPLVSYPTVGNYNVTESVKDNAMPPSAYCSVIKTVSVQKPIPKWREVAPR